MRRARERGRREGGGDDVRERIHPANDNIMPDGVELYSRD